MSWGWMTRGVGRKAFQSILPQGEWRHSPHSLAAWQQISIHTPTRGVTQELPPYMVVMDISIHTPTRGVTDHGHSDIAYTVISIHTPTRGVTVHIRETYLYKGNFNPHSHKGSDCIGHHMEHLTEEFQSTLPQGEWRHRDKCWLFANVISIHTPTRGVTPDFRNCLSWLLFQSTLPQGEWLQPRFDAYRMSIFQSTLPQGEWLKCVYPFVQVL